MVIESRGGHRGRVVCMATLFCVCALAWLVAAAPAQAATKIVVQDGARYCYDGAKMVKKTWKTVKGKTYYFKSDGEAAVGLTKVGKKRYYFNKKDVLQKKTVKVGKWTYFTENQGTAVEALRKGSTYYYANGAKMTKADKKDYQAWTMARAIVKKTTKPSQSKAQKKLIVFKWVMAKYYKIHRVFHNTPDWPAVYALDHFKNRGGDCNSDGSAFTYLAAAVGYDAYVCQLTLQTGHAAHAWCNIGHRSYDPLFAQAKSFSYYYGGYYMRPRYKIKLPYFSPKHAKKSASSKASAAKVLSNLNGLVKKGGATYYYRDGVKVKSKWITTGGKTYYFGKNGKAVTGSVKVKRDGKRSYWVFDSKGVLQKGKKTRVVKYAGVQYRVSSEGRALSGWADGNTRYYLQNGSLAMGVHVVKGKFLAFSSSGECQAELTEKLRNATVVDGDASELIGLLGKQKKRTVRANSCYFLNGQEGSDVIYTYEHVKVTTFLPAGDSSIEYLESVDER